MTRRSWIYTPEGRTIEKGTPEYEAYLGERYGSAPAMFGDEPEFISPITRQPVRGRAELRAHNQRHDVVNWRDLQGLPTRMPQEAPRGIRRDIIEAAKRKGHL
jgi:hypothetical protein